jgi:hypothetical protein
MKFILQFFCIATATVSYSQVKNINDDGKKIRIPVVVHVMYSNADENIPDSLIVNEINDLNLDFSAKNDMSTIDSDFKALVGNPNIEFYLLDTSLQVNSPKGVNKIASKEIASTKKYLIDPITCLMYS